MFSEGTKVIFVKDGKDTAGVIASKPMDKGDAWGKYYVIQTTDGSGYEIREDKIKKSGETQKIEFMNIPVYERKEPVYNSLVFGVPVKYIGGAFLAYYILKGFKR